MDSTICINSYGNGTPSGHDFLLEDQYSTGNIFHFMSLTPEKGEQTRGYSKHKIALNRYCNMVVGKVDYS